MIASANRFHGHSSLRYVYQKGRNIRGSLFAVKYITNSRRDTYRAAVVVSRKVAKSAVVRNRIRRRLYEIIRQHSPRFSEPFDIVVTVYSDQAASMDFEKLEEQLTDQLHKAEILKSKH